MQDIVIFIMQAFRAKSCNSYYLLKLLRGYDNIWPLFWFCGPAACTDCTCGILKDNRKNRLDTFYIDVLLCWRYVYRTDPEAVALVSNIAGGKVTVCGYSSDGSRCAGCIQLSEETFYCKEAGTLAICFCFSRGEIP